MSFESGDSIRMMNRRSNYDKRQESGQNRPFTSEADSSLIAMVHLSTRVSNGHTNSIDNIFAISFVYGRSLKWEIKRSQMDLQSFGKNLGMQYSTFTDFPHFPEIGGLANPAPIIEDWIQGVIHFFGKNLWENQIVTEFFDDLALNIPPSSLIRSIYLMNEVSFLHQTTQVLSGQIGALISSNQQLKDNMLSLESKMKFLLEKKVDEISDTGLCDSQSSKFVDDAGRRPSFASVLSCSTTVCSNNDDNNVRSHRENSYVIDDDGQHTVLSNFSSPRVSCDLDVADVSKDKSNLQHLDSLSSTVSPIDHVDTDVDSDFTKIASSLGSPPDASLITTSNAAYQCLWGGFDGITLDPNVTVANSGVVEASKASLKQQFPWESGVSTVIQGDYYFVTNDNLNGISLPGNLIPVNEVCSPCDNVVEELVQMIQPHEAQITYRSSMKTFLANHVKKALGSKVFETGLHGLRCFLPDDPLRLTVILWRHHSANWHTHLSDRLSRSAETRSGDDDSSEFETETQAHLDHTVCNINYSNNRSPNGEFRVVCTVDSLGVELSANSREDLCLLALFEEVSQMVGSSQLFKRSLLLIRAWWAYEAGTYVGSSIRHYLSDQALAVMVVAIFNRYHKKIFQPLQAFCFFLAEYGDLDWANSVITLQGVVPFVADSNSQPAMGLPKRGDLLGTKLLDRYWELLNLHHGNVTPDHLPNDDEDGKFSVHDEEAPNEDGEASPITVEDEQSTTESEIVSPEFPNICLYKHGLAQMRKILLMSFEKRGINILHPLNHSNMMNEKLNDRRAKKISQVFQMGAKNMQALLKLCGSTGCLSVHTAFSNFFRNVYSRFGTGWRPDVLGNAIVTKHCIPDDPDAVMSLYGDVSLDGSNRSRVQSATDLDCSEVDSVASDSLSDLMKVSLEAIWNDILYCNLVLDGRVTDVALLVLTQDILLERGTLPVGEIGKMLQELTTLSSLSAKLKEKYGGLKKFLEKYDDQFLIGTDHPFNPHVFLKRTLTSEDVDTIMTGNVPPQLLAKFKKLIAVRKKKPQTSPIAVESPQSLSLWGNVSAPITVSSANFTNVNPVGSSPPMVKRPISVHPVANRPQSNLSSDMFYSDNSAHFQQGNNNNQYPSVFPGNGSNAPSSPLIAPSTVHSANYLSMQQQQTNSALRNAPRKRLPGDVKPIMVGSSIPMASSNPTPSPKMNGGYPMDRISSMPSSSVLSLNSLNAAGQFVSGKISQPRSSYSNSLGSLAQMPQQNLPLHQSSYGNQGNFSSKYDSSLTAPSPVPVSHSMNAYDSNANLSNSNQNYYYFNSNDYDYLN